MNKRQQGNSISRLAFLSQELLCPASPLLGARGRYPRGVLGRAPVPGDVLIDLELALASRVIHVPYLAEDGPLLPEKEKGEGGGGLGPSGGCDRGRRWRGNVDETNARGEDASE